MTIFAILMPKPQPDLAESIKAQFPDDHLCINDTQWLVSSFDTAIAVTAKIGIYDANSPSQPSKGSAIVFAISSYYGRAPASVWDWIKSKLEAHPHG